MPEKRRGALRMGCIIPQIPRIQIVMRFLRKLSSTRTTRRKELQLWKSRRCARKRDRSTATTGMLAKRIRRNVIAMRMAAFRKEMLKLRDHLACKQIAMGQISGTVVLYLRQKGICVLKNSLHRRVSLTVQQKIRKLAIVTAITHTPGL